MANTHMKRYSILVVIREMYIKIRRSHFTPTRMAVIQKTDKAKCRHGFGETERNPYNIRNIKDAATYKILPSTCQPGELAFSNFISESRHHFTYNFSK